LDYTLKYHHFKSVNQGGIIVEQFINSLSLNVLQKSLDGLWLRQRAISDNLANVDTPNYKSKTVTFEQQLSEILSDYTGDNEDLYQSIQQLNPQVEENTATSLRQDGNNVDIDSENVELARTTLQYQYMVRKISDDFSRLRYVINGGR
jgi:flagellar basal-body rod protein FlgB